MPKPPSIFISYAHRDGGNLALRLNDDLKSFGFDVWLDKHRLKAGDRWTNEIENALDHAEVVLALLSEGSFASDTCRAEQNWALDAGKHVIPVKVQSNYRVQLRLHALHSCVPRRDSSRRLPSNCHHIQPSIETSRNTPRTSARAIIHQRVQSVPPTKLVCAEDEFERARR